jgi:hypothetical protein
MAQGRHRAGESIGRAVALALALALASSSVACDSTPNGAPPSDGSVKSDAGTKVDAPTVRVDATPPSDATTRMADGSAPDAGRPSDAGSVDGGSDPCARKVCGLNQVCDPAYGACVCAAAFVALADQASCVPAVCTHDSDCDDGNACNGSETCSGTTHQCLGGTPFDCGAFGTCMSTANVASCRCAAGSTMGANGACVTSCPIPLAPDLSVIANTEVLNFVVSDGSPIELAVLPASASTATAVFQTQSSLGLTSLSGLTRILAQTTAGCASMPFSAVTDIRPTFAPAPPDPTTTAVAYNDPRIVGWATGCASYLQGPGVTDSQFAMPSQALGPAGTDDLAVVSLGNGGSITLTFASPITDGDGWDFAVYENSFAKDIFLELGFVEVSSDGAHFARFDSGFTGPETVCANCSGTAAGIGGMAGAYIVGYGTPFDLSALRNSPLVRDGTVDLTSIEYVRVVDIIGDGTTLDSFGRGIIDPISSGPTAGFDLDGIAVLNQRM